MGKDDEKKDYEVGYKRPPKAHQFKPGQSGNKGHKKHKNTLEEDLQAELQEILPLNESGKNKSVTKQRALVKRLTTCALNANISALKILFNLIISQVSKPETESEDLSEEDKKLLEQYYGGLINDKS